MGETVMVVDDESIVTLHLEESLTELGYEVVGTASSAEQAVEKARSLNPRLVLMDIVMPGEKDGITAAEEIQSELDIPVIYLTAYTDKELIERAKRTLPSGYVVKPFETNELCAVIEIALHNHKLNRRLRRSEGALKETVRRLEREITDRERSMGELLKAHKDLQRIKEDLQRRVGEAQQRLFERPASEQSMAYEKNLAAGVSHEMLHSLSHIAFLTELLMNDQNTPSTVFPILEVMKEQAQQATQITNDMLAFAGHRPLGCRQIDVNETLRGALEPFEGELRERTITVTQDLSDGLPPLLADEDLLQQAVLILLKNARDVMPEGGRITLRSRLLREEGGEFVELRVEDTGPGIAQSVLENIFNPFFTTKPRGEGTGLGLSMCKGIVESHGGSILAENLPGGGAAFVLRLTASRED